MDHGQGVGGHGDRDLHDGQHGGIGADSVGQIAPGDGGIDGFDHADDTGADRGCDALDMCSDNSGGDRDGDRIRDMMTDVILPLIGIVLISALLVCLT